MKIYRSLIICLWTFAFSLANASSEPDGHPPGTLTVFNGSGGGQYQSGASVSISATPPEGYHFVKWYRIDNKGWVQALHDNTTTFTMPAGDVKIVAISAKIEAWFPIIDDNEELETWLLLPRPEDENQRRRFPHRVRVSVNLGGASNITNAQAFNNIQVQLGWFPTDKAKGIWHSRELLKYWRQQADGALITRDSPLPPSLFSDKGGGIFEATVWFSGDWTPKPPDAIPEDESFVPPEALTGFKLISLGPNYNRVVASTLATLLPVELIRKNDNSAYDPNTEALGVSNYVTTDGLPQDSQFNDTCADPENFRLQARVLDPQTNSAQMKLEVLRGSSAVATHNYTLDKKDGDFVRGRFLRLVSDTNDDDASGAGASSDPNSQTVLVKLGDKIKVSYDIAPGSKVEQGIQVGRPSAEDNNEASKPWKHDIRELKVNIVVLKNLAGTAPVVTRAAVDADIETTNERLAQAGIRLNVLSVNVGQGDGGVNFPAGPGADYSDGFDATLTLNVSALSPDEDALFGLKDADKDSIDIFYADFSAPTASGFGQRGFAYQQIINLTGNIKGQNNILMSSNRTTLTMPHEIMHILLNANHRADPATALFKGGTTPSKDVGGTKRIGPYPDATTAGVGQGDTTTIRQNAETLP